MNSDQQWALAFVAVLYVIFGLSLWRRRQNAFYNTRKLIAAAIGGLLMFLVFQASPELAPAAPWVALIVAVLMYRLRPPRRRGMKAKVRRRVIAKWMLSTGKKYDPQLHEIDHVIPFSKGGSDTEDNLRVVERKRNRSKGAKSPWWDTLSR